jgi:hypothetical protein
MPRYTQGMLTTLACPICLTARERETIGLQRTTICADCGGWFQLAAPAPRTLPILVIVCQVCRTVYDRRSNQSGIGMDPVCPKCGAPPELVGDPRDGDD